MERRHILDIPVTLNCGCETTWHEGETLETGVYAWCDEHGDTTVAAIRHAAWQTDERWIISGCFVSGVTDLDSLMQAIASSKHDCDPADLADRIGAETDEWDWSDIRHLIEDGKWTADGIDQAIHAGLR